MLKKVFKSTSKSKLDDFMLKVYNEELIKNILKIY